MGIKDKIKSKFKDFLCKKFYLMREELYYEKELNKSIHYDKKDKERLCQIRSLKDEIDQLDLKLKKAFKQINDSHAVCVLVYNDISLHFMSMDLENAIKNWSNKWYKQERFK